MCKMMFHLVYALLLVVSSGSVRRLEGYSKQKWSAGDPNPDLTHMTVSDDGKHIYVFGKNMLFNLNASTLELLNSASVGPFNSSIKSMMYTVVGEHKYLVTCSNITTEVCFVRNASNVSEVIKGDEDPITKFQQPIGTERAAAFFVPFMFNNEQYVSNTLFIACPHNAKNCSEKNKPGITWIEVDEEGNSMQQQSVNFKSSFTRNNLKQVLTERYVSAFPIDKFRLFFSVQKKDGEVSSRVAQICQHKRMIFNKVEDTTKLTYADMKLKCGEYSVITDAKKITVENETIVVASFRASNANKQVNGSAICIYTFGEIQSKLLSNIKECYKKNGDRTSSDYIDKGNSRCPGTNQWETFSDDQLLCNIENLPVYLSIIGTKPLNFEKPNITYSDEDITAFTMATKGSEVIGFYGTEGGHIIKSALYPEARKLRQRIYIGQSVNKDMYTSAGDQSYVYAMTKYKVVKFPVEECQKYKSCKECLSDKDPFCGWCMIENRCSESESCQSQWITVGYNDTCPTIENIHPSTMSVNEEDVELKIQLSHMPENDSIFCRFSNNKSETNFSKDINASITESMTVTCLTPSSEITEDKIKGSLNVSVQILTSRSEFPIMESSMTFYNCKTFTSCSACIQKQWNCNWCVYQTECLDSDKQCTHPNTVTSLKNSLGESECPTVTEYISGKEDNNPEYNGIFYLSEDEDYAVIVNGTHFPVPQNQHQRYRCHLHDDVTSASSETSSFEAVYKSNESVHCTLDKTRFLKLNGGRQNTKLFLSFQGNTVDGIKMPVTLYKCETLVNPKNNCGKCKSFAKVEPYFKCRWCDDACRYNGKDCNKVNAICPNPHIKTVYPLSAHINATTRIEITGVNLGSEAKELLDAVTIADKRCVVRDDLYVPSEKVFCDLDPNEEERYGKVVIALDGRKNVSFNETFFYKVPTVTSVFPIIGPKSGGTIVTISGVDLDTGRIISVHFGEGPSRPTCKVRERTNKNVVCITSHNVYVGREDQVHVVFDGEDVTNDSVTYKYKIDPIITGIYPKKSFSGGGRKLTVVGTNLDTIQAPKIFSVFSDESKSRSYDCSRNTRKKFITCPSPTLNISSKRRKREAPNTEEGRLGFEMDNVASVRNLADDIARLVYYPNPVIVNFTKPVQYERVFVIKGSGLGYAATKEDYYIWIGNKNSFSMCNITDLHNETIRCNLPKDPPPLLLGHSKTSKNVMIYPIHVQVGSLQYTIGNMTYNESSFLPHEDDRKQEYIIAGAVVGFLVFLLFIVFVALMIMVKKRRISRKENDSLAYKMDKLEATIINQCREEFASLQTTMSDLTSDLEGGNILFRDYDVYASKTLFANQDTNPVLAPPTIMTSEATKAMDIFRGLLRNQQFLLMFIRTLEKEKSFSIHDRSHVATYLMVLNHDNMEFITGILNTLLNDLVDKNMAAQTPKLLLRRSESVSEKMLTHWLSVCLYHYLKERSGSALFILYKAIKIQVEKGPVDYITGCGKYTLSEDKLFTSADKEINPQTLTLQVNHFDYIDNEEKTVPVPVLDCDTITQAKSKMLEILYKNVAYSQRPTVHSTSLAIQEEDGTQRKLHDEDPSSEKEGIWKRINTLLHYKIADGTKVVLAFNRDMEMGDKLSTDAPDTYILSNSYKRTKQVVRTVSGSNFWHLTKHHREEEDEVTLARDLFLPRLLNTKGTLQTYIDDLFKEVLTVGDDPPLIIKYLYDQLDSAADRHGVTDPDVVHTWKCNSLLLRFWVNIIKNPEFVFDIYKPHIVDSCLSVIAQTLMDSCSTADLRLDSSSPSNKLLFAKDIPRYKNMVKEYFQGIKNKPAISEQELNSYFTEKVSQKFSGKFHQASALLELYKYAAQYRNALMREMDNAEASSPGSFINLTSKLELVLMSMDMPCK